ncbi:hypothetical protein EON64_10735 [archaeon]|nr:MAG: hypothetical protein EON64_10735 [archaeon]
MYVSEHSFWGGRPLNEMMNSLGVAPSNAIKIRRRVRDKYRDMGREKHEKEEIDEGDRGESKGEGKSEKGVEDGKHKSRSSSILDPEYLRKTAEFWLAKPSIPDTIPEDSTTDEEEVVRRSREEGEEADVEGGGALGAENFVDIIAPSFHEVLCNGDVVFIASAQDAVQKMMKSISLRG